MEWTQDQIAAVIGTKELELISLRLQLAQALARINELEAPKAAPDLTSIEGGKSA